MKVLEFSKNNIKKCIAENKLVLVDFFSSDCGLCNMAFLILKRVALDFGKEVVVGKINIEDASDYTIKLGIKTTPMLVFFKDGYPVAKMSGFRPAEQLKDKITEYIS